VLGKESIVASHALARPSTSTKQDDFVGRMLWALSDKSGLPAKRFAEFNPVPPLDWLLDAFSDERFGHKDLVHFNVPPNDKVDAELRFSLVRRPAPYDRAQMMMLAPSGVSSSEWDRVMLHLARWLTRHLNDSRLILWIVQQGGRLHISWPWLIEEHLDSVALLERDGKIDELDDIRSQAPNAIPDPFMRTLWRLLIGGRVKSPWRRPGLHSWEKRLKRDGLNMALRLELRELLAPQVALTEPFRWGNEEEGAPAHSRQPVDCELVLAADHVYSFVRRSEGDRWISALPQLLQEFQQLLRDALDMLRELGQADDRADPSYLDLPSITPHRQNQGFKDWVCLIELLRDAWLALRGNDSDRALRIAHDWFDLPYPTFKRLAFFAASQDDCIPPRQWVDWLVADGGWWLWSTSTRREVFRLLVLQGPQLADPIQERLEAAILAGPPRKMYRDDMESNEWRDLAAHAIWLRLAKLNALDLALGESAAERLANLSSDYPDYQPSKSELEADTRRSNVCRGDTGSQPIRLNFIKRPSPRR